MAAAGFAHGQARALVARIARHHFGSVSRRVTELSGGLNNAVWRVPVRQAAFVVRLHAEPAKVHDYLKEQWAMEYARAAGVPAPRVLEVGTESGHPYMIIEEVRGLPGTAATDREKVLRELGRLAARLHGVRTHGFGSAFDWSGNRLSKHRSWDAFLDGELGARERLRRLVRTGVLRGEAIEALERALEEMRGWRKRPVLNHGDLRLKNVIIDPDDCRVLALIDWDECMSAPAPYWDLSIALHDLGVDEKEAFVTGYGLRPQRLLALAPALRLLNTLHYAFVFQCAQEDGETERSSWLKARLRGAHDLAP